MQNTTAKLKQQSCSPHFNCFHLICDSETSHLLTSNQKQGTVQDLNGIITTEVLDVCMDLMLLP